MKIPGRENYYKYHSVRSRLEEELQVEQPAKVIAGKLKIAVATFHKYKNFLQIEKGRQFITSDERTFRERLGIDLATHEDGRSQTSASKSEPERTPSMTPPTETTDKGATMTEPKAQTLNLAENQSSAPTVSKRKNK